MTSFFSKLFLILVIAISCFACQKKVSSKDNKQNSIIADSIPVSEKVVLTYHVDSLKNKHTLDSFLAIYNITQQKIIAATNRLTPNHFRVGMHLIIPDTLFDDFIYYSPFPATLEMPDSIHKFVLVNQRIQLFAAYENGKQVRFGPISSGRKAKQTPNGLFHTNYKSKLKTSTVNGEWKMPFYFNIENKLGVGMHQYDLPGYPASHSCVRMYEEDAKWLFDWADQWKVNENGSTILEKGTPVLVFSKYDFSETAPWKLLPENKDALQLTNDELTTINEALKKM